MATETVFILLFIVATAVAIAVQRLAIPYTVALVFTGLALGLLHAFEAPHLTKALLFNIFLPGLLFEAAFHINFKQFWRNRLAISSLALPGVVAAIVLTSLILTPVTNMLNFVQGFSWKFAMVFGALISASDPIAVISIFKNLGVPKRLAILLEGESLLNDGTAIVFFTLSLALVTGTVGTPEGLILNFIKIVGIGALIGIGVGVAVSQILKHVNDPMIEITLTTIAAYGSFLAAEHFLYSGVIAAVSAGMICGNYGARVGMSPSTRIAVETFWEYVAFALNSIVFLLIGLEVHFQSLLNSWLAILVAYLVVTFSRALVIFGVSLLLRRTREKIPLAWSVILTWGGLRGVLPMVLVLSLPVDFPYHELLISMTFGVVIISIIVHGLSMSPLLRKLGIVHGQQEHTAYELMRGKIQTANAALKEIGHMSNVNFTNPEVLADLRYEYEEKIKHDSIALNLLHLNKEELHAEEIQLVRHHLLLVEKGAINNAYHQGVLSQSIQEKLLADIDAQLLSLESADNYEATEQRTPNDLPDDHNLVKGLNIKTNDSKNIDTTLKEKTMKINPNAGKPAEPAMLVNVPKLITAYYNEVPDPSVPAQRVAFGTSGHRGSSFDKAFNEWHILAISQAICLYRIQHKIDGPLFLGMDTHALSVPAFASAVEVLAANGVEIMIADKDEYTPTPVISHAIITYNHGRKTGLADGIVITPSHNPPHDGGFKYNPPNGGPAANNVTDWIETKANEFLKKSLKDIKRIPYEKAIRANTTHRYNYLAAYVGDLGNIIDMNIIRDSKISLGVDPLGGAGVHYWEPIAERYGLNLTVVNKEVDPTFRFMTLDWDSQIRMDPSSPYAMQRLINIKDRFDIAFACDTDHDRHGIVTRSTGLLPPNHYLAVAISYLFQHRSKWIMEAKVGKTVVSSQMIDRVTTKLGRKLYEVPVGFKWFVNGLLDGSLGFGGEESAGASFVRMDGTVWTTDKDGIVPALLSAEITAKMDRDPGQIYSELTHEFGESVYDRVEAPANTEQKKLLSKLSPQQVKFNELAGEKIQNILTHAPGNGAPIGGMKVITQSGWFAARPSGTEDIYKIYAESFNGQDHLHKILEEAQIIVDNTITIKQQPEIPPKINKKEKP